MAGSLVLIDSDTASSSSSIALTGVDSTYNVYLVTWNNLTPSNDSVYTSLRFTVSGTGDSDSNYDYAMMRFQADSTPFYTDGSADASSITMSDVGTATGEVSSGILYLFQFSNASEYSFITYETVARDSSGNLRGRAGSGVLTETQANDGVEFIISGGNIASGEFKLYGLTK